METPHLENDDEKRFVCGAATPAPVACAAAATLKIIIRLNLKAQMH